ncbi:MAG: cyclic nucleotide-binding domain-containing protein [Acidobacteria bacterium]|nr:cyclic nucleotide-binding domain-containing protein [Acidobacteriota bacterium]MBK7598297.1 cyclic nucleotide-binding domain-containing protein [Acidobacteriota bacterium]MBK8314171.1 cyclic nucleotide-binding domain-containing protein [Acidobacteriota bacterium]MBK9708786.1 cyclic nucleotide-binding domain-containing protein [Acidobacteriota bacterium]
METLEPLIAEHPFFRDLPREYIHLITGCASNVRFDAGQYLFREEDEANQFYLIRQGKIAVEVFTPQQGRLLIQTMGAGEVLGWSWLVPPYKWRFDSRAIELTRAISMDGKCLRAKCEDDPRLGYELFKRFSAIIAERLHATRLQMLDIYGTSE